MAIGQSDGSIILSTKVDTSGINKGMNSIKGTIGKIGAAIGVAFGVSALVNFGYIYKEMLKGKYKRVLIVPTGAIFSPTFTFQKESIPAIANCVSLEVIE